MADYWQDKRINHKHVACAWALVLVVLAGMVAVTHLVAPTCPPWRDAVVGTCANGNIVQEAVAERQP